MRQSNERDLIDSNRNVPREVLGRAIAMALNADEACREAAGSETPAVLWSEFDGTEMQPGYAVQVIGDATEEVVMAQVTAIAEGKRALERLTDAAVWALSGEALARAGATHVPVKLQRLHVEPFRADLQLEMKRSE